MKKLENLSRKAVTTQGEAAKKIVTLSNETLSKVVGGGYSAYRPGYEAY